MRKAIAVLLLVVALSGTQATLAQARPVSGHVEITSIRLINLPIKGLYPECRRRAFESSLFKSIPDAMQWKLRKACARQ